MVSNNLIKLFLSLSFLFSASFIFNSCTTSSGSESEDIQSKALLLSPSELKMKINEQSAKLTSLDCEGDITIDSPELNNSGSLTLSAYKPDSIFCRLDGPFGISIARFLITRNNFIYYNVRENYAIKGSPTPIHLGSILKIKLTFDDLLSGYLSSYNFSDTSSENCKVSRDKDLYYLIINLQSRILKYSVNPSNFYIEKYEIFDTTGNLKLQISYSDFEFDKNIYSPRNIYLTNPTEKQNLWISYEKKVFNKNRLNFKITIPRSARIINWD